MPEPRWLVVDKKLLLGLVVAVLVLLGIYRGAGAYYTKISVPPEELLAAAMEKTLHAGSLRFSMLVKIGDRVISDVQGVRVAPDRVHITGTMQDMPVEFIHTGEKTFIKGYWSDNWTLLEGNKMAESELFVTEFNPLGNFNFKDVPIIKELKAEEIDGVKYRVLELKPIVQNALMELSYDDFKYCIWVHPSDQVISRARIEATGKHGKRDKLEINMKMWDFNKQLQVTAPDV
ncbi:hypothetical protein [Desulfallas thermosapovorans]|uniref:LppX_LprAFG lipoprotein n=1 Tax=Desulfallas thermosapovorans DSM 6562 TaxID=1121431 RepID=A0A5S4ZUA7_9FIRM|nr:hypothetical protein [Desulfallas thermosapovorans]TYO96280.1 hypothetical protein LX24_01238 [Desulfallas thermosapovorans DSM 6562]